MILKSLKLHNIRSYKDSIIEFPETSFMLSGDIGSGKSTILLGIEFALFGFIKGDTSGSTFLRHGEIEGSVELSLVIDGKNVVIKRILKRNLKDVKQTAGYVIVNGVKQDLTIMEIKSKVLELLGYPVELLSKSKSLIFRYTVFTPQEDMKRILYEETDLRLDILRKVFNIDKYKKIRDNASFLVKTLKSNVASLEGRVYNYNDKMNSLKDVNLQVDLIKIEILNLEKELSEVRDVINFKKVELVGYEDSLAKYNSIQETLSVLNSELGDKIKYIQRNNSDKLKSEEDIYSLDKQINVIEVGELLDEIDFVKQFDSVDLKIVSLQKQKNEFESRKLLLQKQLMELQSIKFEEDLSFNERLTILNKIEDPFEKIKIVEGKLFDNQVKLKEVDVHISSSNSLKEKMGGLDDCPTCLQPVTLDHKTKVISFENSKLSSFNLKRNFLVEDVDKYKLDLTNLTSLALKYKESQIELNNLRVKIAKQDELKKMSESKFLKINEIQKQLSIDIDFSDLDFLKTEKNLLKEKLDNIRKNKLLFEKRKNLISLKNEKISNLTRVIEDNATLRKRVGMINSEKLDLHSKMDTKVKANYDSARTFFDSLLSNEKDFLFNITTKKTQLNNYLSNKSSLVDEIKIMDSYKLKITEHIEYKNFVSEHFVNLMIVLEKNVMFTIYSQFNDLFTEWFNILIEDENLNVKLLEDFSPVVEQNGYETSISNLSGGEKTACALAYRLALNKVINDVQQNIHTKDLIILDEPTDGFSSDQLDKIRDVLEELDMNQVVIVSHENKVESFVEKVIKINKNEHISSVHQMS